MNQNEAEEYTLNIFLNNPTFTNSAISYSEGILKSTDKNVSWTEFSVQTNKTGFELSGRINFTYSNLGVDYPDRDQLKVYPNPVMEKLIIGNGQLTIRDVVVFDANGRKQKIESIKHTAENKIVTNISHLPAGIYFVKVITDNGEVTEKIIKQ